MSAAIQQFQIHATGTNDTIGAHPEFEHTRPPYQGATRYVDMWRDPDDLVATHDNVARLEHLVVHLPPMSPNQFEGANFTGEPILQQLMVTWREFRKGSIAELLPLLKSNIPYRYMGADNWELMMRDIGERISFVDAENLDATTPVLHDTIGNPEVNRQYRLLMEPNGSLYAYIEILPRDMRPGVHDPYLIAVQIRGRVARVACHLYKLTMRQPDTEMRMQIEIAASMSRWNENRLWREAKQAMGEFDAAREHGYRTIKPNLAVMH
jgi:hypothetical protein